MWPLDDKGAPPGAFANGSPLVRLSGLEKASRGTELKLEKGRDIVRGEGFDMRHDTLALAAGAGMEDTVGLHDLPTPDDRLPAMATMKHDLSPFNRFYD